MTNYGDCQKLAKYEISLSDRKTSFALATIQVWISHNLGEASEDEKPTRVNASTWTGMQKVVMATIELALSLDIK